MTPWPGASENEASLGSGAKSRLCVELKRRTASNQSHRSSETYLIPASAGSRGAELVALRGAAAAASRSVAFTVHRVLPGM